MYRRFFRPDVRGVWMILMLWSVAGLGLLFSCRTLPLECRKDQECAASKPFCLGAVCKECRTDADCKGGLCDAKNYACTLPKEEGFESPTEAGSESPPKDGSGSDEPRPEAAEPLPEKECNPSQKRPCYGGDPLTKGIGECKEGTQTCTDGGMWGRCEGEIIPTVDLCGNAKDDDCDGKTDETCCTVQATPFEILLTDAQAKPPSINSLSAFSANLSLPFGKTTIIATSQFDMYVVDLDGKKQSKVVQVTDGGAGGVNSVVGGSDFHPQGTSLVTGDYNGRLTLWDTKTWTILRKFPDPLLTDDKAHSDKIHQALFSPDGIAIFSVSSEPEIKEWRSNSGQLKSRLAAGHPGYSIALGIQSGRFFSGHLDGFVLSWDLGPQKSTILTQTASTQFSHLAFDPLETRLAIAGSYPVLWDLVRDAEVVSPLQNVPTAKPLRLAYHPAGKWLAIAFNNDSLGIWDTTTGTRSHLFEKLSTDATRKNVWGLVWAKGGEYLIAGAYGRLQVWACQ